MKSRDELSDLMIKLIESTNSDDDNEVGFPERAREIIREIAAYAVRTKIYSDNRERAESFWTDGATPSDIYCYMLGLVVGAPTVIHRDASVILHMPALAKALGIETGPPRASAPTEEGGA